jgi:hypothetical protein
MHEQMIDEGKKKMREREDNSLNRQSRCSLSLSLSLCLVRLNLLFMRDRHLSLKITLLLITILASTILPRLNVVTVSNHIEFFYLFIYFVAVKAYFCDG